MNSSSTSLMAVLFIILSAGIILFIFLKIGKYNHLLVRKNCVENSFITLDDLFKEKIDAICQHKFNDELAIQFAKLKKDFYEDKDINNKITYIYQINLITDKISDKKIKDIDEKIAYSADIYNREVEDFNNLLDKLKNKKYPRYSKYKLNDEI